VLAVGLLLSLALNVQLGFEVFAPESRRRSPPQVQQVAVTPKTAVIDRRGGDKSHSPPQDVAVIPQYDVIVHLFRNAKTATDKGQHAEALALSQEAMRMLAHDLGQVLERYATLFQGLGHNAEAARLRDHARQLRTIHP
jgi:hypothetical protein